MTPWLQAVMAHAARPQGVLIPGASITPASIPNPELDTPYFQQLSVSGATGTFTFEVTSGFFHTGLGLSAGGAISGTATGLAPGTIRTIGIRATRENGDFVERTIALTLQAAPIDSMFVGAAPAILVPADGNTISINLGTQIPNIQDGDYVMAVYASDNRPAGDLGTVTGLGTFLPNVNTVTRSPAHFITEFTYSSASPIATIMSPSNPDPSLDAVLLLCAFRNVIAPTSSQVANVESGPGNPNFPSRSISANSIVVLIGLLDDDGTTFAAPSGYTMAVQGTAAPLAMADNVTAGIAYRKVTSAGPQSPGSFTSSASDSWNAYTIELRETT